MQHEHQRQLIVYTVNDGEDDNDANIARIAELNNKNEPIFTFTAAECYILISSIRQKQSKT